MPMVSEAEIDGSETVFHSHEFGITQKFSSKRWHLARDVALGSYSGRTTIRKPDRIGAEASPLPARDWAIALIQSKELIYHSSAPTSVRVVDLYCGAGGFSHGLEMALRAVGLKPQYVACVDLDSKALDVYAQNHDVQHRLCRNVDAIVDYSLRFDNQTARLSYEPELLEPTLRDWVGQVQIVVGGPPCQGHSNFNNHTRRADPRNTLYLTVPAIGIALRADVVVMENVPSILNDKSSVVQKARAIMEAEGYFVDQMVLEASRFGVAQQRKRHFLVASRHRRVPIAEISAALELPMLTVWDAVGDLETSDVKDAFDLPADISEENRARIEFLFENNEYNLPNEVRPDCHKEGHTYPSVYGRLRRDQPAQTITSGFLSPGRGRFVHPTQRRGLTPHEAARLQGFPDTYQFQNSDGAPLFRKDYSKLIGDAVPPPLAYVIGLAAVAGL